MTAQDPLRRSITAWLEVAASEAASVRLLAASRLRLEGTRQRPRWWPVWRAEVTGAAPIGLAAAAALVVAVMIFNLIPGQSGVGGSSESASPSATIGWTVPGGLPPVGSIPIDPTRGDLAIRWDGSITRGGSMWVYEDGRVFRWFFSGAPKRPEGFVGITEQRLTLEGVEFLRSAVMATGLFDRDRSLARDGNAPFLFVRVRDGDQTVSLTWAWRGITGAAPTADPDEETALLALNDLLADPGSWPASLWADATVRAFVPSEYSICFRVWLKDPESLPDWGGPVDPAAVRALVPAAARAVLAEGTALASEPGSGMSTNGGCSRITTDAARAVAQTLGDAGLEPVRHSNSEDWLNYELVDPSGVWEPVWMQFGPVLPDGHAVYLGPG